MGISGDIKIYSGQDGKSQALGIRTFYHLFLLDEDRIQSVDSILKPKKNMWGKVGVPVIASLLYLKTKKTFMSGNGFVSKKEKKIKKESITALVDRGMGFLEKQRSVINNGLPAMDADELRQKIIETIDKIGASEGALKKALENCGFVGNQINKLSNELTDDEVLLERNAALLSQYRSDINRLTFIIEGQLNVQKGLVSTRCPFCDSEVDRETPKGYVDSIIAEEKRIEIQIRDLMAVQEEIRAEYAELENNKDELIIQRNKLESHIRGELQPQIIDLKQQLEDYRTALKCQEVNNMIAAFSRFLCDERIAAVKEEEEAKKSVFNEKEKFKEFFAQPLNIELDKLLRKCEYQDYVDSFFNMDDWDVTVNGHSKRSQGKGFRAFLNTIMAIALQNCLRDVGYYQLPFLVVDSPILTLKEKGEKDLGLEDEITGPMKQSLFYYILNHSPYQQTIVIENEIPNINYSKGYLIKFTKDLHNGRYGLIEDYWD